MPSVFGKISHSSLENCDAIEAPDHFVFDSERYIANRKEPQVTTDAAKARRFAPADPPINGRKHRSVSIEVKFQQRYQMRNRILSKTVPALEFCPFRTSQKCVPLVLQFWGFDSDGILQLFV